MTPSIATAHGNSDDSGVTDLATHLQRRLDGFPNVGVIPFGWIALLILLFILVVGPLDYFLLQRLWKRLEWTWITFPVAVALVTAAACFGAYALKGTELRINKLDLVDIDLMGGRCYGTTWVTVYSPRTESYTVRIEPSAPLWTTDKTGADARPVVSWFGRPESGFGGYNRPRSQIVFERRYEYAPDASGLERVPIPVWSSKSFTADWDGDFKSEQPVPRLHRRQHGSGLAGIVTNPLSVVLLDAALVFGETGIQVQAYQLGTLMPGQSKPIAAATEMQLSQWLSLPGEADDPFGLARRIMFYEATANLDGMMDRELRYLDQSWRRSLRNGAMLVGRLSRIEGPADKVAQDPQSPSRLSLSHLGDAARPRQVPTGTLTQDTLIRVFVPVRAAIGP